MATILDTAILVGKETTYGTKASTWTRAYEGKADSFKRNQEALESVGFRAGMETVRSDRRRQINMGGEGGLEIDVLSKGFGLLLQGMLGTVSGPTQIGATTAYTTTAISSADDPDDAFSVQVLRTDSAGTQRVFTHLGSVITGWELKQEVNGLANVNLNFDFQDVNTSEAAGTPSYPASALPYDWTQCVVSIGGSPVDVRTISLSGELGMKTDRRYLKGSALKAQPKRAAVPSFTGNIELDMVSLALYANFVAGDIVPITFVWTGANISGAEYHKVTVTLASCQFDGSSPEASLDDLTSQALPFKVLDNGTDPAVSVAYISTDTSL